MLNQQLVQVVEDNEMIRNLVEIYLRKEGYDVITAVDGEEAKEQFLQYSPCAVILDLMLPKLSGEEVCRWIRSQKRNEISIIMLTAKISAESKINGLRIGADDYVIKPFSPEELMARVEAVLRRSGQFCQKISLNGLIIQPRKGVVLLNGKPVNLTKYEFNLLFYFMENPNIVLSREQLIQQIHPHTDVDILDRTIDAHIKKLREKIEDVPSKPKKIQTVRGMGYRFVV
ncbi:response regulator transcription factor [Evansella cellulosilytica]|uniref:Two component transcriptional regulator, winged helix family n=1 Tax=Evansella cellulosilytica (strain ATCC 21833 / DSM 2522 / FERM P-1141 / JCM 9156 / N-4) TaxID=649639 RepID=E6TTG1_EVAC2|nr:response regulator transcription factor [Evansella cellulosilytica]ADU29597.1 two component transcriptional regulator, winged helix family [Evansella cellulosilytica DSM 2522]